MIRKRTTLVVTASPLEAIEQIVQSVQELPYNPSRDETRRLIKSNNQAHYVYILRRPTGELFYVGKGQNDRAFAHEADAIYRTTRNYKLNIIRALHKSGLSVGYSIDKFFASAVDALIRERELIQCFGRHNLGTGPLANLTDGGEGPANFSEETRQRHRDTLAGVLSDDSERSAVNAFFLKLGIKVKSVPIKPLSEHPAEPLTPHPKPRSPKPRQAAAIAAAAIGNGLILAPGVLLRRRFKSDGCDMIIENGVGRDLLKSGMLTLRDVSPTNEILEVTRLGYESTVRLIGTEVLIGLGALMPDV